MINMLTHSSLKLIGLIWNIHTFELVSLPVKPGQASPLAGPCQSLNTQTSPAVNITYLLLLNIMYFLFIQI